MAAAIVCEACGKRYKWMPQLIGKQVKCVCGQMIRVYANDMEPAAVGAPAESSGAAAPAPRRQAVSKDVLSRLGVQPIKRSRVTEADKEEVERQRVEMEQLAKGNFFRDWILPIPIIAVGLFLIYVEQTRYTKSPADTVVQAIMMVGIRAVVSVAFVIGAMFLAMMLLEVRFLGEMKNCILRFCAIALGPAALYGILSFAIGHEESGSGAMAGVFASIAGYALLFWGLMRLDLKDTAICVMLTWILVSMANYMAYRAEGMMKW